MNTIEKTLSNELSISNKMAHLFSQLLSIFKYAATTAINTPQPEESHNTPSENISSIRTEERVNDPVFYVSPQFREIGVVEFDEELNVYFSGKYLFANKQFVGRLRKDRTPIIIEKYYYNTDVKTQHRYPFFSKGFSFVQKTNKENVEKINANS